MKDGEITLIMIKELRAKTGAGVMDCKNALLESKGNLEKAAIHLHQQGLATVAKRAKKITSEGLVESYVHYGGKIGVLVEVNCETDFVAKTDEFQIFAHDIAMHVAASNPFYLRREDIPAEILKKEKKIQQAEAKGPGKSKKVQDKLVEGRMEKFFSEVCLLDQLFIKNTELSIGQLLNEMIAKLKENITIRRFVRYQLGENLTPEANEKA
jgi:elongation factor Ts